MMSPLAEMMPAPGATTFGFISSEWSRSPSSRRGPSLEKLVTRSSVRTRVLLWLDAPTVMARSAEAGEEMLFWVEPLPEAAHTTMPAAVAALSICALASLPSESHERQPSDRLSTSIPR